MTHSSVLAQPRPLQRAVEWFWRGQAFRAAHNSDESRRSAFVCEQRARIAEEVARHALEPSAPWRAGDATQLACALFVESIGWSLRLAASDAGANPSTTPLDHAELVELSRSQRDRLLRAAGDEAALSRVLESLLDRRFETEITSEAARSELARELANVAKALLLGSTLERSALETVMLQRVARLGLLGLVIVALVAGGLGVRSELERRADLARGREWTTSSQYDTTCVSPQQHCQNAKYYFFHTQEERSPWVRFDLQQSRRVSKVVVSNRRDCCLERAVPLVVEVSSDGEQWREVARAEKEFEVWTAKFSPTPARYVRLRVARRTMLHLESVRVFG